MDLHSLLWRANHALAPALGKYVTPYRSLSPSRLLFLNNLARSGGTLFTRLFDGHPDVAVLPYAAHIGWPYKAFPTGNPASVWRHSVFDPRWQNYARSGFVKKWGNDRQSYPLTISARRHYRAFLDGGTTPLAALAAYCAAWKEWKGSGRERNLMFHLADDDFGTAIPHFFEDYPDSFVLTVIREPLSWAASYLNLNKSGLDIDALIKIYLCYCADLQKNRHSHIIVVRFEDLVMHLEDTMQHLCARIGIEFSKTMLMPTFNGEPVAPNSSFHSDTTEIDTSAADRSGMLTLVQRAKLGVLMKPYEAATKAHIAC